MNLSNCFRKTFVANCASYPLQSGVSKLYPDALVIAGGGGKSMASIGSICVLKKAGHLKNLKLVAGTSAGAIVAAGVALDRSLIEVCKAFVNETYTPDFDLTNFTTTFGIDTGAHLNRWIDIVVHDDALTFSDVKKMTGIELVVCATNLTTRCPTYFSARETPDMSVKKAIKMSCSIPMYFSTMMHDGCVYVDGALVDSFPYDYVASLEDVHNPMGIRYKSAEYDTPSKIENLNGFLKSLVVTATKDKYSPRANNIMINVGNATVFDFKNPSMLRKLFHLGVVQTREYLKKNN